MMPIAIQRDERTGRINFFLEELDAFVPAADALDRGLVTADEQRQLDAEIANLGWEVTAMNERTKHQLALLAAEIRDDAQRAESMGRGTVGLWALMAYANRLEKLLAEQREASE